MGFFENRKKKRQIAQLSVEELLRELDEKKEMIEGFTKEKQRSEEENEAYQRLRDERLTALREESEELLEELFQKRKELLEARDSLLAREGQQALVYKERLAEIGEETRKAKEGILDALREDLKEIEEKKDAVKKAYEERRKGFEEKIEELEREYDRKGREE